MKLVKSRSITQNIYLFLLMNIISFLYFLVNVQCVNENANKQYYSILCFDDKCTEKIADAKVNQEIIEDNPDYLNANINDTLNVFGLNKEIYLVRKQLEEGLVSRKSVKIIKNSQTPTIEVDISFKNKRVQIFVSKNSKETIENNLKNNIQKEDQITHFNSTINQTINQYSDENLEIANRIDSSQQSSNDLNREIKDTKVYNNEELINKDELNLDDLNKLNKLDDINKLNALDYLDKTNKIELDNKKNISKKDFKIENIDNNKKEDEIDLIENNKTDEINNLDEEEKKLEITTPPTSNQNNHYITQPQYVKMNSIESSTADNTFNNQANSDFFCSLPPSEQAKNEMNFYLDILRFILGKVLVDRLPDYVVNFLKIKLLISAHLIVFLLLVGIIWLISFIICFIYQSIDNKSKLKNQICDLQAELSSLKNKEELIKKNGNQTIDNDKKYMELKNSLQKLMDEKLNKQLQLDEINDKNSKLIELNNEITNEKNQLMKELKEEIMTKSKIELNLNEKLKNLEDDLLKLNKKYESSTKKNKQNETLLESQEHDLKNLNENLNQLKDELKQKDNEIQYLNNLYEELKNENYKMALESNVDEENDENNIDLNNQNTLLSNHELIKLKHDFEKVEKEKDELIVVCKNNKSKIAMLEEVINQFDELKNKLINEKNEAEKYTEYSKKYLKEKENELYDEMQLIKTELEETKKLYLKSEKYSSDYWKENQNLKNNLNLVKRDNEKLRKQIIDLMKEDKGKNIVLPPPPEMPKAVLDYLRNAISPTQSNNSVSHAQSPSNQSQISAYEYYLQQNHRNSFSHSTISPTNSISNQSIHSIKQQNSNVNQNKLSTPQTSPKSVNTNYLYGNSNDLSSNSIGLSSANLQSTPLKPNHSSYYNS